ncbi:MAG: hypothetical protein KY445_08925 [Armatimonadetes bacterium]|nr:hypothetical protein [Armatimonadota bacterium]
MNTSKIHLAMISLAILVLAGCGSSSTSSLRVGQKLKRPNGVEWGTIVELSDSHTFENGETKPGALVDPTEPAERDGQTLQYPQQWVSQESLERELKGQKGKD